MKTLSVTSGVKDDRARRELLRVFLLIRHITLPSFLSSTRSKVITAAAAGTVTLATALSVVAVTAPPSASPVSATADAAFISAASPSSQASVTAQAKATQAHALEQQITAEKAAPAAKAAAAKAAAARAAAKAAAAKHHTQVTAVTEPSGSPEQIAQQMLGKFGWSASQFSCLQPLWEHESGWNVHAENPSSGAYGIAQALPASQMASAGPDWQTNAATQIKWGLTYIHDRYGSPCGAWAHEESVGWY